MKWATLTARLHVAGFWGLAYLVAMKISGPGWLVSIGWSLLGLLCGWFLVCRPCAVIW